MESIISVRHYNYYLHLLKQAPHRVYRRLARRRCDGWKDLRFHFIGKYGLEIGGPSRVFEPDHLIPIYSICRGVDACNFTANNLWTKSDDSSKFGRFLGEQFVAEACQLSNVCDEKYDFVLASHVLEHTANPIRALQEWKRVLCSNGVLAIIVPHKLATFDHRRAFTTFEHLKTDFHANITEDDLTHFEEVVALHDLSLDPPAGSFELFRRRCLANSSIRAMHHHVFSPEVLIMSFDYVGLRVLNLAIERPFHIIAFGQKSSLTEESIAADNQLFLDSAADWRKRDPFHSLENSAVGRVRSVC